MCAVSWVAALQRGELLHLEEALCQSGRNRAEGTPSASRRKLPPEAPGGRSHVRQAYPGRSAAKKGPEAFTAARAGSMDLYAISASRGEGVSSGRVSRTAW